MLLKTTAALVLLPAVFAQTGLLDGLSANCKAGLLGLVTSPVSTCLNVAGLVPLISTPSNSSWVKPLDTWLTGVCSAPACTTEAINTTLDLVATACKEDLTADDIASAKAAAAAYYPTARKVACLKDTTKGNEICVTSVLSAVEATSGVPLSPETIYTSIPALASGSNTAALTGVVCTKCGQAIYSTLKTDFPDLGANYDSTFSAICGKDFISGSMPTDISLASTSSGSGPSTSSGQTTTANTPNAASPLTMAGPWSILGAVLGAVLVA